MSRIRISTDPDFVSQWSDRISAFDHFDFDPSSLQDGAQSVINESYEMADLTPDLADEMTELTGFKSKTLRNTREKLPPEAGLVNKDSKLFNPNFSKLNQSLNLVDTFVDKAVSASITNDNNTVANQLLSRYPTNYAFQNTDKLNASIAIKNYLANNSANQDLFDSIRTGIVGASQFLGPEIGIPVALLDMTLGNTLDSSLFSVSQDNLKNVPYNRVRTYGDFGMASSNMPVQLMDSISSFNG